MTTINSVWSAYGHTFTSTDDERHESCLTCGALFELVPDPKDPTHGDYRTASGDEPQQCTRDTSMVHGYPGERDHPGTTDHNCNCLSCDS